MRPLFLLIFLILSKFCSAQKVHVVEHENEADIKVYVVNHKNKADLIVYKVKYRNQADDKCGYWYYTNLKNEAEKKIFFVKNKIQADLLIKYTEHKNEVQWNHPKKEHLICEP